MATKSIAIFIKGHH